MKATTITKYQTSDGRMFGNREAAQTHELTEFFRKGEGRVTVGEIISTIMADPEAVISKIKEVTEE